MTVSERWWSESRGALESSLLPRAVRALWEEDRRLAEAFAASPVPNLQANRGLAYYLFETTLVYAIFKDWLRYCDAACEVGYPDAPTSKADLLVREGGAPTLVCEAKWWWSNAPYGTRGLEGDIQKLLSWPDPTRKMLLTFWHSPAARDDEEFDHVVRFAAGLTTAIVKPLYLGRFCTDFAMTRGSAVHHFSLAAFTVCPLP
jgi:hypothetical protein